MIPFRKFRIRLHNYFLQRKLKNADYPHRTCNYEKAESIGILFDGSIAENVETVKSFSQELRAKNKKVTLFGL